MNKLLLIIGTLVYSISNFGQIINADDTIRTYLATIEEQNNIVVNKLCDSPHSMIITNKAFGNLIGNKVGSYLSEAGDLSLFGTYATLNTTDGSISINQSFIKYRDNQQQAFINSFFTVGLNAKVADGFSNVFSKGKFNTGISLSFKWTRLLSNSIFFDERCVQTDRISRMAAIGPQKLAMNIIRAKSLTFIRSAMREEVEDFERKLQGLDLTNVKSVNETFPAATVSILEDEKNKLRTAFYTSLKIKYAKEFAKVQEDAISDDDKNLYNSIHNHWLSIIAKVPLYVNRYNVAASFASKFELESMYPYEGSIQYNFVNQNRKGGTLLINFSGGISNSNSIVTDSLKALSVGDYKGKNGIDTLALANFGEDKFYVGKFDEYIVPIVRGQLTFFPKGWQKQWGAVGLNLLFEQQFGAYNSSNGKFGIPIRLNDKDGEPKINFEIQLRTQDFLDKAQPDKAFWEKSAVGISVGLPFGSLVH